MIKKTNCFKALGVLALLSVPNFASNNAGNEAEIFSAHVVESIPNLEYISKNKLFLHIATIESRGAYNVMSKQKMLGKYQASRATLLDFGYSDAHIDSIYASVYEVTIKGGYTRYFFDTTYFSPKEQERFIRWYTARMENIYLKKYIEEYVGKTIDGVYITKAGMLHASMLGFGHVRKFLDSDGEQNYTPKRGYSVRDRLQQLEEKELEELMPS